MISKACVVGAYQTKLEEIASHDDVELTVIVPPYWRDGRHRLSLEWAHVSGYRLIVAPIAFNGSFHLHFYPTLPSILRESKPDICHIDEEPYNLAAYLALWAARRVGARSLFFCWQNLLRRYPWPFCAMERYAYRNVATAIAGSHDALAVLRAKGYTGPACVMPQFGVDPALFQPTAGGAHSGPPVIGFAGRLVEEKGLRVLIEALAGLGGDWQLLVLGTGPMRAELEARFADLGLLDRVHLSDWVASGDVPRYLATMDVLVVPSLTRPNWKEQFGRVLVEAMSCGVAVVGSDCGEIPHVIGDAGLVFPEGDAHALRQALAIVLADESFRRGLGHRGRARVLEHYTQARVAAETVDLYRTILSA
jgi:glycosyltransferase involved in cell wall biosynthesis